MIFNQERPGLVAAVVASWAFAWEGVMRLAAHPDFWPTVQSAFGVLLAAYTTWATRGKAKATPAEPEPAPQPTAAAQPIDVDDLVERIAERMGSPRRERNTCLACHRTIGDGRVFCDACRDNQIVSLEKARLAAEAAAPVRIHRPDEPEAPAPKGFDLKGWQPTGPHD